MGRRVYNLERDIRSADWMLTKIRKQEIYAQNFYAALCNNAYTPKDVWGILSNITWDCTWRYAALIISEIREDESFIDWYCSGTGFQGTDFTGFVEESYITAEVESDINSIGWLIPQKRFIDF